METHIVPFWKDCSLYRARFWGFHVSFRECSVYFAQYSPFYHPGASDGWFRAWGLGFRAWGLGFEVIGFKDYRGLGLRVWGFGFRVWGCGVRVIGFRVWG